MTWFEDPVGSGLYTRHRPTPSSVHRWAYLSDGALTAIGLRAARGDDALTALDGWYGGVEFRLDGRASRLGDGTFPAATKRGGRKLTLAGVVQRNTAEDIERYERALSGLFPSGETKGWLEAENSTGVLLCEGVEPDGAPRITTNLDYRWCQFEVPLYSSDPHLYGPVQSTTAWTGGIGEGLIFDLFDDEDDTTGFLEFGSNAYAAPASLVNVGNATAYPKVIVQGSFPAGFVLRLTSAGRVFGVTYNGPVTNAAPLVVDMRGSVTMNGVDQSRYLTVRDWDGVAPHGGTVTVAIDAVSTGAGSARLELRSTYL